MKQEPQTGHYINGRWMQGLGQVFTSTNPADNSTLWQGTIATEADVSAACEAARSALPMWAYLDISSRIQHVRQFAKRISECQHALSRLIALETGKPWWEAQTETAAVIGKVELSIQAHLERTIEKQTVNQDVNQALRFKPHGVVAVLGPFNFPAHLSNGHIIPALLAGNTVVYKPSELTPA
ncbi:MAG TPA: N-succinylglutamate 5-semialdehyde dehydrogenase, partial [Legionella sp.]|nr:N-succinylglutamate 5-semialdehyde dehydrogenase [Legionella sp.]